MRRFSFHGSLPASKSILNRLLVLQSYEPSLKILASLNNENKDAAKSRGDENASSQCDDVVAMKEALAQLAQGEVADCASAGTTFRFLALRASRIPGEHVLTGTDRLFARPQSELVEILSQLGVQARIESYQRCSRALVIQSKGWQPPVALLKVDVSRSSQFLSAVLLNAWDLDFPLEIEVQGSAVSEGYEQMTEEIVREAGLHFRKEGVLFKIEARQKVLCEQMLAELDLSSAFAVAALAAVAGKARIEGFPVKSLQPDAVFVSVLEKLGVHVEFVESENPLLDRTISPLQQKATGVLSIQKPSQLRPLDLNLMESPDLFPVLSVLCALAPGVSHLTGAPQLKFKESDRIAKTAELIKKMGRKCVARPDGLEIHGSLQSLPAFTYSCEEDHRLAMAAAVAKWAGADVQILNPDVVTKSFPEFWEIAG